MPENKTKPTGVKPTDFLARVETAARRADAEWVDAMLRRVSGDEPYMYGGSIVGYGTCHYKYESGREGDMPRLAFSPRKSSLVLYLSDEYPEHAALMSKLGKHSHGVSCLYIKKLADVDKDVLEELARRSLAATDKKYPK